MIQATTDGHTTLLSAPWYLDYISYGVDWPKYYQVEPQAYLQSAKQQKLVLGGEVRALICQK